MSEQIPNGWKFMPIHSLGTRTTTPNTGLVERNLLSLSYGEIVRKDIETGEGLLPESFETYQIVEAGDTILRFTDLQNDQRSLRSGLVPERGIITSAYLCFHPDIQKLDHRFFAYTMRSLDQRKVFYEMGSGVRQNLNWGEFAALLIPVPPLETQRRIADYLDKETAEIDAMVRALESYRDLVEDRSRAVIIDGFKQLESPELNAGLFVSFFSGRDWATVASDSGEIPVYGTGGIIGKADCYLFEGDGVLFGRKGTLDKPQFVTGKFWVVDTAYFARPGPQIVPKYSYYWAKTVPFEIFSTQTAIPSMTASDLARQKIRICSLEEQEQLVEHLDNELAENQRLQFLIEELRSLLIKRRQVLINDVVTGKKQV